MAKRILVPLDRTPANEHVLPLIADAARGGGSTVRLLHVDPVPDDVVNEHGRVVAYADQEMARLEVESLNYLEGVEAALEGVPVERVVRFGDAAREILIEAEAWGADLIAMTVTRGRWLRGIGRGRVADRIIRRAEIPVMLYRPSRLHIV